MVEVDEDRLLADEDLAAGCGEDGDGVRAGALAQQDAVILLDRHLPGQVVDAELGQPLPDTAGGGTPLGLPQLVHLHHYTTKQLCYGRDMSLPHPLPEDLAELIARRFRVLGDPLRVRMLDLLREQELSVNALAEQLGAGQQNVSKHLALLADAGMLARRKDGTHVYYRIADAGVLGLCEQVCGSVQAQLTALAALIT
jgi:DNA-binding transcriptional ArsR family regulator